MLITLASLHLKIAASLFYVLAMFLYQNKEDRSDRAAWLCVLATSLFWFLFLPYVLINSQLAKYPSWQTEGKVKRPRVLSERRWLIWLFQQSQRH